MHLVLTLIGPSDGDCLTHSLVDNARTALARASAEPGEVCWLAPGCAADIFCTGDDINRLEEAVRQSLGVVPVDIVLQPSAGRRKKLLVADMDSTMITVECIDELADVAGVGPHVAAITERAMRGEIDFEGALRERVGLLQGMHRKVLRQTFETRVNLTPGGRELVMTMRAAGAYTALVSGGFTYFTDRVSQLAGFQYNAANRLVFVDDRLTGHVADPIVGADMKRQTLRRLVAERGIAMADSLAVGDGANDLPMIKEAGLGVAFHAKPIVDAAAGARIRHGDLTALLYVQGYSRNEILP